MKPEADRIKSLFLDALGREVGEREAFLDEACGGDGPTRARVEALLRASEDQELFLAERDERVGEAAGQMVGRYKLLQEIGEGGFGSVWMAEQLEPVRRKVALKVIKLGMDTKQVVARFEAERQALALMDHPNIAKVLDGGVTESGRPFFVMELVRGVPITEYCDEAKLTTRERLELFMQVCHAVQHAHQKGIVHRDIKPSNVMLTLHDGRPVPMVIDFGIAKATSGSLTDKTLFTEFRQFLGTPEYTSPEQAELSGLDVDTRADIYSLGVLLYELLTGTTPLDPHTLRSAAYDEILRLIREVEPQRPSTRVSTLGERQLSVASARATEPNGLQRFMRGDLDWIVMKALEKERTRRYESATSFAEDVQRFLRHEPVVARPPSRGYKLAKYVRRNRALVGAAAAALLALVAGTTAATVGFVRAERGLEDALAAERLAEAAGARAVEEARNARLAEASERTQRERAATEAAAAAAINAFYDEMLFSIDPLRLRERSAFAIEDATPITAEAFDRNVSVVEMLRGAADSVGESFRDKPELAARVRETIGVTLLGLGRPEDARTELDLAAELYADLPDVDEACHLRLELLRGTAASHVGADAQAEELIRGAWTGMQRLHGKQSPRALHAATLLGRVLSERGKYEAATELLRETLALQRAILTSEHRDTIHTLNELACCYSWQTNPLEAEPYAREAYELAERILAPDDIVRVEAEAGLGLILEFQLERERAAELLRSALAKKERLLGPEHESTAWTMHHLARSLDDASDLAERERLMRGALSILRRKQPGSPAILVLCRDTALTLFQRGDDEAGLELMQEYADGVLAAGGLADPRAPEALRILRRALERAGRHDEARVAYEQFVEMRRVTKGENALWTCSALWDLCRFFRRSGDVEGARDAWQGCLDVRQHLADRPEADGEAKYIYADMLLHPTIPEARDPAGAAVYLEQALVLGLAPSRAVDAQWDLALAYELAARPADALEAARTMLADSARLAEEGQPSAKFEHARRLLECRSTPLRDPAQARSWLERGLARAPRDDGAWKQLYSTCLELGDREAARDALERLIALRAEGASSGEVVVNNYLWALVASEFAELRPPELVAELVALLERDELGMDELNTVGVARYRLGRIQAAIDALEEGDRRNTSEGRYHPGLDRYVLAMCYHAQGRPSDAAELLRATTALVHEADLDYDERMEIESFRREAERLIAPQRD